MDIWRKIFISLLFVALISLNLAKNLYENYELSANKIRCNDEGNIKFLENLKNVEKFKSPVEKVLIVLTDTENIYPPLKNELSMKNAIFLPLHETFKTNITDIYKNVLFLESAVYVKFIIHSDNIEKATKIFQEFVSIFKDISDIYNSVGIALTLNTDVQKVNIVAKLNNAVEKLNRPELIEFVGRYLNENGPPIAIFNKQSSNNLNVATFIQNIFYSSRNEDSSNFQFNLDMHFQIIINCATDYVKNKVIIDVKNFAEKRLKIYFDTLTENGNNNTDEASTNIAKSYNYLLRFAQLMSSAKTPRSFLQNMENTFEYTIFEETFKETYFLPQNIDVIQFLYMTSDTFNSALEEWTKPLKNFKLENPEKLVKWYQKEEGGYFYSRNFETNCIVIREGRKLQVRGKIIRLSEIDTEQCGRKTRFIEIFAVEKVIVNDNLDLSGKEIQVAIIAPIWEVIGRTVIKLNGKNGDNLKEDYARNGNTTGNKNGADGRAGLPGGPAGSFYGIANKIINGHQLNIFAFGGAGGKGQDGGHGAMGKNGDTLQKGKFDCTSRTAEGFKIERLKESIVTYALTVQIHTYEQYLVYGQKGQSGGRGGNGGAYGLGGNGGSVILFDLSKEDGESYVRINNGNGKNGAKGLGGYAGLGGKNGDKKRAICAISILGNSMYHFLDESKDNNRGNSGKNGVNGISLKMRQVPKIAPIVQSISQTINEYKLYVRPELTKNNGSSELPSFYDSLNSRQEITNLYDTKSLVDEFTGLELQRFGLQERYHLIPLYRNLQQRIHNYSIKANYEVENNRLFKDIIIGIEDRINDTLRILNKKAGYSVMTKLHKGLNYLLNEVKELEKQKKMDSDIESLNTTLSSLDDLTEEAKFLIGDDLKNAMTDLENTLDGEINSLLEEISELQKASKENEKELIENRQNLQKIMVLKGLFGLMKIGCVLLGAVNPALGLVSTAAISSLSVLESQLTQTNFSAQVAEVPKAVKLLSLATETFLKKDEPNEEELLELNISQMMKNVSNSGKNVINGMRNRIKNIFKKSDSEPRLISYKSYDRQGIYIAEENVILNNLDQATKENDMTKVNDCKISLNVLKYLKVNAEVLQTTSDTVSSIMKDVDKVAEIDKALKESSENLKKLYIIEEKIYADTEPMLKKVTDFVDQAYNNINEINENQIIIAEWNVANTIENVQRTLNKTFDGFQVPEEMNWTLQKILVTFQKVCQMHNNILSYQRRKSEIKYTAMLQLSKYSKILAKDHHLTGALIKLETAIWYNKINEIYKNWRFAFKQFSFPNGGDILKTIGWKNSIQNDIHSEIDAIISNVAKFKSFFNEDKDFNEILQHRAQRPYRGSCSSYQRSFFVWSRENSLSAINNILNGKEETIVAHSPTSSVNALKFNKIGILFTSTNPEIQRKLFEILKTVRVNLTHHGDSHYRFNNKTFEIKTNQTVMTFNYPETCGEISSYPSLMYEKIANGDYMLSPFATWTIKLYVDKNKIFPKLEEFLGQVDLELIGEGLVFENNECNKECEATMRDNYKYAYDIYY